MTLSVYAKKNTSDWVALRFWDFASGKAAWFNVNTGTIGTVQSDVTAAITSIGNGWYRCSITRTTLASLAYNELDVMVTNADNTNDATAGNSVFLWGAQLEIASTASSYQRITDFTSDFLAAFPTHALYQDSAGTTPVTALGQPVGLVLDKSKGGLASLGSELITNGGPFTATTGWTAVGGATLTVSSGALKIAQGATDYVTASQAVTTVVGRTYRVTYEYVSDGTSSAAFLVYARQSQGTSNIVVGPSGIGPKTFVFTAVGTTTYIEPGSGTSSDNVYGLLANISVREVPGSHLIQATSASRPTCDARVNLLTYSEQFENAAWSKFRSSVTANAAVAPDGTTTADKLVEDTSASTTHFAQNNTVGTANTTETLSLFAKPSGRNWIYLQLGNSHFAYFDVANGAIGTSGGTGVVATITAAGNGWYRCAITGVRDTTQINYIILASGNGGVSYTGNGIDGVLIWGAQLETGSTATTYQRVVTASDYADVNAPRYLTCDGVDDSLYTAASVDFATWTSGTRRNLLTYPSAFDNAVWSKGTGGSVTANTIIAPDGTTTADAYTWGSSTGSFAFLSQFFAGSPQLAHTFSIWLKRPTGAGSRTLNLTITDYTTSSASSSLVTVTEDWQRFTFTRTSPNSTGFVGVGLKAEGGSTIAAGDVLHVWGAQLELGSTATSFQDVGTDKMTVVTGVRKLSDAARGMVVEHGSTNYFLLDAPGFGSVQRFGAGLPTANNASGASVAAPVTMVLTGQANGTTALTLLRRDGAVDASVSSSLGANTFESAVLYAGRRTNSTLPFNGRIYQLIVRGAQTDTATVQQTERFVAGKTGVVI